MSFIQAFEVLAPVKLTAGQWNTIARRLHLNPDGRELEVLQGVAAGLYDAEIQRILGITHGTLRTYLNRLFDKCKTRNRIGIAMRAMEALITQTRQS